MVCLSTAEAEFVAATEAAKDVLWLQGLLGELGVLLDSPAVIYEDNQACVAMINNSSVSSRNRHFAVKMCWLREQVSNKRIIFKFVASKNNLADTLTKVLPQEQFCALRNKMMKGIQSRGEC